MGSERSITLLHLSDMQFGAKHRFDGEAPGSLLARLREDFEEMRQRHGLVPDLILVTGDLVEVGKPSEFKQFARFAAALVEGFGLARRRLVMIPGNHDISRAACEAYFKDCEADEQQPRRPYWPKWRNYAAMFAEFYAGEADLTFTEDAPHTLFEYPELGVVVAGLNSTMADSHRDEDHYGFLGEEQLRHFAGKLRMFQDQGYLRIAAVHHHPVHPEGQASRQDLKELRRILEPYVNLVVHGHIHEDELNWFDSTIPVLGVGSAGVQAAQRPAEIPNQYQWIRLFADRLEYGSRAYVPDQKRWVGDLRPDRAGERWWQQKRVMFERVTALSAASASAAAATSPEAERALALFAYRKALNRQLRRRPLVCDIATYGEDGDLVQGLDLLTIFVPQRAVQEVPRSDRPARLRGSDEEGVMDGPGRVEDFSPSAMTVVQPIDAAVTSTDHPWTLVLGTPGAGKTTLTLWLALKLSADGEQLKSLSPALVPVRIELRLFVERWSAALKSGRSYDFFDYLDDVHREESRPLGATMLRALAEEGLVLWLFDGLDEVALDAERRTIADMIIGVREQYKGRGVVTGRLVGCRPLRARFHDAEVHCFTLLDFEEPQIEQFLGLWHALAFPNAADLGARRLERLRQALATNAALRDLAGNPLLLTLIALLNRGDELPRRRHELLERAAVLMLSQWEANKGLPAGDTTQFDLVDKRRFLAELAWHMLNEVPGGAGNVIEADALRRFTERFWVRRLAADAPRASSTAQALIEHLRARNYVLGLLGGQSFGFLHKAFLEFFAAEEVFHRYRSHQWRLEELEGTFKARWQDAAWHEVLTLTCGLLQEDRPETVVSLLQATLLDVDDSEVGQHVSFCMFSVRCLAEVRGLERGAAHEFAVELNRYLWAGVKREQDLEVLIPLSAESSPEQAVAAAAGTWPAVMEMLSKVLAEARPLSRLSDRGILIFAAGLDPELRFPVFCSLINDWKIGPSFICSAIASGIWGLPDTEKLGAHLASAPKLHTGVVLALAQAAERHGWRGLPKSLLVRLDPDVESDMANLLAEFPRGDADEGALYLVWQIILARLAKMAITNAPPEYVRVEVLRLLASETEPTPEEIEVVRAIALRGRGAFSARYLLFRWGDGAYLRRFLQVEGRNLAALYEMVVWAMGRSSEAGAIFDEWTRTLADPEEGERLRSVVGLLRGVRNKRTQKLEEIIKLARWKGQPDWPLLGRVISALRGAAAEKVLSVFRTVREIFSGQEIQVGLYLAERLVRYEDGTQGFADDRIEAEFMAFLDQAVSECPWVAVYHSTSLPSARSGWIATLQTLEFSQRLVGARQFCLADQQLLTVAYIARELQLPWEPPVRHLVEHATDGRLRVLAARELGEWEFLERLAREGTEVERRAARLVLEIRDIRSRLLRIGKLRRGMVLRRGERVGTIEELAGGATRFSYGREYLGREGARPIAPNLPLRAEPYESPGLHPVFEGLLPQGWLLDIDLERYRLKPSDQFGLLLATGRDTIGAIEVIPERD